MTMGDTGITLAEATRLLEIIVSTPSVNPAFREPGEPEEWFGEARLAAELAGWLGRNGLDAELDEVFPGRPNLIARVAGTGPRRMIWEGHLDTVQVTGMAEPFVPSLRDGRLFGRGAVDDGGCIAAFLLALRELAREPGEFAVDFVAAADEEFAFRGVLHHIARGERYAMGVAGEPTGLQVVRACKGCLRWRVTLAGRAAHTSRPEEGLSAIDAARALLDRFEAAMARRQDAHPLLGPATLVCTGIEGGAGPNTVPPECTLRFDYRYLPHEDSAEVYRAFAAEAEAVAGGIPGLAVSMGEPFVDSSAMDVEEGAEIVARMRRVCRAHGVPDAPLGVPYGSDATKLVNNGAIPTVVFGPGSIDQAHTADEHVEVAQVVQAARMLVDLARGGPV